MPSINIRRWDEMEPALRQVHGGFDLEGYLFSAFRQVEGQQDYPAWLFGHLMHSGFSNYLTWVAQGLTPEERSEAHRELEDKFDGYLRACVDGDVSDAALQEVQEMYRMARDMDAK